MTNSNLDGQLMGAKGRDTRDRLMKVTREMLSATALRELRAADIARRAGGSKATFYVYFENVEAVALALAEEVVSDSAPLVHMAETDWTAAPAKTSHTFVGAYFDFWDSHRAVLRVMNLAASEGDAAFREVRLRFSAPLHSALAAKIQAARGRRRQNPAQHDITMAAVVLGGMERNAEGYANYPARYGVSRERLVRACSEVLLAAITGAIDASGPVGRKA